MNQRYWNIRPRLRLFKNRYLRLALLLEQIERSISLLSKQKAYRGGSGISDNNYFRNTVAYFLSALTIIA